VCVGLAPLFGNVQGYLAHKKQRPARTLPSDYDYA
jgi:hypothetical protein